MKLSVQDWHRRFRQQARWTADLRVYLYQRAGIEHLQRVLEVGCGTGAILADWQQDPSSAAHLAPGATDCQIFGIDIDILHLSLAIRNTHQAKLTQGDAHELPYPADCFDLTFCHYLLLWVDQPVKVIREMARVTRPGGALMALAEPDYGGRIDYPEALVQLGEWQTNSLREQGADPQTGRKLGDIFRQAGLESVETGVLGGQWSGPPDWEDWESEWAVLESDLNQTSEIDKISEVAKLKALERSALQRGQRVLFVPTFYAWGKAGSSSI